jgi:hypothetical protein
VEGFIAQKDAFIASKACLTPNLFPTYTQHLLREMG